MFIRVGALEKAVLLRSLAKGGLVGELAHIDKVAQVAHGDARCLGLGQGRVLHVDRVAHGKAHELLGALCDDAAGLADRKLRARIVGEPDVIGEVAAIGHHIERHGLRRLPEARGKAVDADALELRDASIGRELAGNGVEVVVVGHGQDVVALHAGVAVLAPRK